MEWNDPVKGSAGAQTAGRRPLPNTYWVHPGQLLAGEYPGARGPVEAESRIDRLLDAGVRVFVDLTEADELPPYAHLLGKQGDARHERYPVTDHGIPASDALVTRVLDSIDAHLAAGRKVYVHCRAGIGRTGIVIACHLIRRGLRNEAALDYLAQLWQQSERSHSHPLSPETDAQARFVMDWHDASTLASSRTRPLSDRVSGALLGLAAGEAAAGLAPGQWGSDTAMTLMLAESLVARGDIDLEDQMRRYYSWQQLGRVAASTAPAPVHPLVRKALATWRWTRKAHAGTHDPADLDPHTLARTTAVAVYFRDRPTVAIEAAAEASRTTHQSPVVVDACRLFAWLLVEALEGATRERILGQPDGEVADAFARRPLKPEVQALLRTGTGDRPSSEPGGTVTHVLATVLSAFARSTSYREGLERVLATSAAGSTAAAVYGALAGAHYSLSAVPVDLVMRVADRTVLEDIAASLDAVVVRR